jgi:hypothetical protein
MPKIAVELCGLRKNYRKIFSHVHSRYLYIPYIVLELELEIVLYVRLRLRQSVSFSSPPGIPMTRRHARLACVTIVAFRQSTHAHVPTAPDKHGYGLGHEAYAGGYAGPAHDVQGHGEGKARDETSSSKPNIVFFLTVRYSEEGRDKDMAAKGSLLSKTCLEL